MAQRIQHFNVNAPSNPGVVLATSLPLTAVDVETIDVRFPRGCANLVNVYIWYANQQIIPEEANTALTGDHKTFHFDIADYLTGGAWGSFIVNNDIYAHTIQFTFGVNNIVTPTLETFPLILLLPVSGG